MTNKTTVQFLGLLSWMPGVLTDWGAEYVKWLQPTGGQNPFPNQKIIVRQDSDDIDSRYIEQGEAGGRQFVDDMLAGAWSKAPYAEAFELANEPACRDLDQLTNLRLYTIGAMKRASEIGIKLVILNISEGNPAADPGLEDEDARNSERWRWEQLIDAIKLATELGHYVGLHCYWCPGVEGPTGRWHALGRRVWDVAQWADMGVDVSKLRVMITETGVDGGIAGRAGEGWQVLSNAQGYAVDIVALETEARKHDWLVSLQLFIVNHPGWKSFDLPESFARGLTQPLRVIESQVSMYQDTTAEGVEYIDRYQTKNYWAIGQRQIRYILVHDTEGSLAATLSWFEDPSSEASAHAVIDADGKVYRMVHENDAAWHAGDGLLKGYNAISPSTGKPAPNLNLESLGYELVYPSAPASPAWPQAQMDALIKHLRAVVRRYSIPREHILTHKMVSTEGHTDPRNWMDWNEFLTRIYSEEEFAVPAEVVRNAAWKAGGIPYNPEAAFPAFAREHNLGNPETPEFDFEYEGEKCRGQGFSGGIVWAQVDDWDHIEQVGW